MTVELMKRLTPYMAMAKGHMKQFRKNFNSTKTQSTPQNTEEPIERLETRSNHVLIKIIDPQ